MQFLCIIFSRIASKTKVIRVNRIRETHCIDIAPTKEAPAHRHLILSITSRSETSLRRIRGHDAENSRRNGGHPVAKWSYRRRGSALARNPSGGRGNHDPQRREFYRPDPGIGPRTTARGVVLQRRKKKQTSTLVNAPNHPPLSSSVTTFSCAFTSYKTPSTKS